MSEKDQGFELDPEKREEELLAKEARRLRLERERNDLHYILSLPEGRRLLWRYMSVAQVFQATFVPGAADLSSFNEGKRNIGLLLLEEIFKADPKAFSRMQHEAASDNPKEGSK